MYGFSPLLSPKFQPFKGRNNVGAPCLSVLPPPWSGVLLSAEFLAFSVAQQLGSVGGALGLAASSPLLPKPPSWELLRDNYC